MKKTILIIDDFENSLFITSFTLQQNGFDVLKAVSGEEALKYLDGRNIHLIITDYNMPKIDGLQLVERIKLISKYIKTPIFVLSNEKDPKVKEKATQIGVTAWIKKPFATEQLLNLVKRAIS